MQKGEEIQIKQVHQANLFHHSKKLGLHSFMKIKLTRSFILKLSNEMVFKAQSSINDQSLLSSLVLNQIALRSIAPLHLM